METNPAFSDVDGRRYPTTVGKETTFYDVNDGRFPSFSSVYRGRWENCHAGFVFCLSQDLT